MGMPAANTAPATQTVRFIQEAVICGFLMCKSSKYVLETCFLFQRIPLTRLAFVSGGDRNDDGLPKDGFAPNPRAQRCG
jgi:hypothetical protein